MANVWRYCVSYVQSLSPAHTGDYSRQCGQAIMRVAVSGFLVHPTTFVSWTFHTSAEQSANRRQGGDYQWRSQYAED